MSEFPPFLFFTGAQTPIIVDGYAIFKLEEKELMRCETD